MNSRFDSSQQVPSSAAWKVSGKIKYIHCENPAPEQEGHEGLGCARSARPFYLEDGKKEESKQSWCGELECSWYYPLGMLSSVLPDQKFFSFAEIVQGRDSSVRITDDRLLYAVDLCMVMTGLERNQAGMTLRRLTEDVFPSIKLIDRKLSGKGNAHTKLISFQDAIELVMVLPGKIAKETRVRFADIIKRYLAGDQSMVSEIQANAASEAPIAQLARASLDSDLEETVSRKRQLKREDVLFELELAERRQRVMQSAAETQAITVGTQKTLRDEYTSLCPGQIMDDRARLMFKDNLLNLAALPAPSAQRTIEDGVLVASPADDARPMTASTLAAETGKRYSNKALQRIGAIMSKNYEAKYGQKASQHEQYTDGAVRLVRSYTRRDKDMLLEAFRLYDMEAGVH